MENGNNGNEKKGKKEGGEQKGENRTIKVSKLGLHH
jgi:hypothetical protein